MLFGRFSPQRRLNSARAVLRRRSVMGRDVGVCEALEPRQLLVTYQVPAASPPHTAAYLTPGLVAGRVQVRLDSPENEPSFTFNNTSGLDEIQAPSGVSNFLFIDRVPVALKPTGAPSVQYGIKVQADSGSNATLRIEANLMVGQQPYNDDRHFSITQSSTSETRIESQDVSLTMDARDYIGTGVTNLYIRTNDFDDATGYWPPNPPTNANPGTRVNVDTLAAGIHLTVDTGASTYAEVLLGSSTGYVPTQASVITGAGLSRVTSRGPDLDHITLGRVDFGTRSSVGNNYLKVDEFSTMTLAQAPDSSQHVVVLEEAVVDGGPDKPAILYVAHKSIIDDLSVFSYGLAIVQNTANETEIPVMLVDLDGDATIEGQTEIGVLTNEGDVRFTYDAGTTSPPTTVDQFKIGSMTTLPNSSGNVIIDVDADVTILAPTTGHSPSHIGDLRINEGATLVVASHPTNESARVLGVGTVFVEKSNASPQATLDLKNNAMLVDYASGTPVGEIEDLITVAYNGGDWEGFGLGSSTAAAVWDDTNNSHKTGVGYGEATDIFSSFPASWEGQSVDGSTVLVKYTLYGDATLGGGVNLQDFNKLAANFGGSGKRWTQGDFNYDNGVNLTDFNRLAGNFGQMGNGPDSLGEGEDEITTEDLEEMLEEWQL